MTKVLAFMSKAIIVILLAFSAQAKSAKLRVAMGPSKQPYVSEETKSGIEYELITEPLKRAGFELEVLFLANKRAQMLLREGKLDAAIDSEGEFLSEPYIVYQNMAITFCDRKIDLKKVADLADYKVGAFHNANKYLGEDFAQLAKNKERYQERQPQETLNSALMKGIFDVAISDINIFKHNQIEVDPNFKREICPFEIFEPTRYRLSFKDPKVRDKFNEELKKLGAAHFYEELAKKYKLSHRRSGTFFKPHGL